MQTSWLAHIVSFFVGALLVIGSFIFHPVTLLNLLELISSAEFWTAGATVAVACFTYFLKQSTDKLWVAGEKQFRLAKTTADRQAADIQNQIEIAKISAEHMPRTERAYVYGGFGGRGVSDNDNLEARIQAQVTMANYGKTPGFIKYIEYGTGNLETGIPEEPIYPYRTDILDLYFPLMRMEDVRSARVVVEIPSDGQHVVFQRVWYTDVFNKLHFSGSIYRLEIKWRGNSMFIEDEPIMPGSTYWAWDKEAKNKRAETSLLYPTEQR